MTHRGRNVGEARSRTSTAESASRRQTREDLDRKLDEALDATFPASDPFDVSPCGRNSGQPG